MPYDQDRPQIPLSRCPLLRLRDHPFGEKSRILLHYIIPSKGDNTPIYLHRFNDNLKRVCDLAEVKYYSSHGIRFHIISAMYDAGVDEKEIQRLSGHTTANMTRHYNKSIKEATEDEKIRRILN